MNVEYDSTGRMKYCPELHPNKGKPWSDDDIAYLKEFYSKVGAEEMSLALGRPVGAVVQKASLLHIRSVWHRRAVASEKWNY